MSVDVQAIIDSHEDEFLKFDRVANKRSQRRDLHAFLLLDELVPGKSDIVDAAGHDQIWLSILFDEFPETVTEEQVIELIRCGVFLEEDTLSMFV